MSSSFKSARRSWLFTPGDSRRKMARVKETAVDTVILDLEDAIAVNQKDVARQMVVEALAGVDFGHTERLVRINAATTPFFTADLQAVANARPDGIVLPKTEAAEQIQLVDRHLAAIERENGWTAVSIRLFPIIETALGVMNAREIAGASPRLDALLFGAEDLAVDLGALRTAAGWEVFYGRSVVVTAAAAYGLQAIDTVFLDFHDLHGLEQDAMFARQMGYTGKMAIHPRQVAVINRAFSPTAAEIRDAQRLIDAYEAHVAAGEGVFVLDGRMVDMPLVQAARNLLERAGG